MTSSDADIAWIGEGRAVAVFLALGLVVRIEGSRVLTDPRIAGPQAVAYTDELGLLVSSNGSAYGTGLFQQQENGDWQLISGTENLWSAIGIWPIGHGALVGGDGGFLYYYDPRVGGVCPPRAFAMSHIFAIAVLEDGVVLGLNDRNSSGPVPSVVRFVPRIDQSEELPKACTNYRR